MRRRVWFIDAPWSIASGFETSRVEVMSTNESHIGYYYEGEPANIHGVTYVCRLMLWRKLVKGYGFVKQSFINKWNDGSIAVWLIGLVGILVLSFAIWSVMHHEGMI